MTIEIKRYVLKSRPWSHSYLEETPDPEGPWIHDPFHKIDSAIKCQCGKQLQTYCPICDDDT